MILSDAFREQVRACGDLPALHTLGGDSISYRELDALAEREARDFRRLGVSPGERVGVQLDSTPRYVLAVLAAARIGASYVPIPVSDPMLRTQQMLDQSGVSLLVRPGGVEALARRSSSAGAALPDEACVFHTSGSTGSPKGVAIGAHGIRHLVFGQQFSSLSPGDVMPLASNLAFDASTFEIWGTLLRGGTLLLVPRESLLSSDDLGRVLRSGKVSHLHLTSALFQHHARSAPEIFGGLRELLTGGESIPASVMRRVVEAQSRPERIYHMYGPTECTTFCFVEPVDESSLRWPIVPLGGPIGATEFIVRGPQGEFSGQDDHRAERFAGELIVGGSAVALGYVGSPDTSDRFTMLGDRPGRWYQTGDNVRPVDSNKLLFEGRSDSQVKLRGYRIELGEVEGVMRSLPGIAECIVTVGGDGELRYLVAHVVLDIESKGPKSLDEKLKRKLPSYMIPRVLCEHKSYELTANGKINRGVLTSRCGGARRPLGAGGS